jgi:bacterial/archaeal transporter family protein
MNYLTLSLVAVTCYGVVAPLVKLATRQGVPAEAAVVVTNIILVLMSVAWAWYRGVSVSDHLTSRGTLPLALAGVFLGLAIISYYAALSLGPLSVVVPIYGLFIVTSSLAGFVFFGETLTLARILGLVCALAAIYLVSRNSIPGS